MSHITDINTCSTSDFTLLNDLALSKSDFYKPPKAANAFSTSGTADARSLSAFSFKLVASVAIFTVACSSITALSFSFYTIAFSLETTAANFSADSFFLSTSTVSTTSCSYKPSTYSAVS